MPRWDGNVIGLLRVLSLGVRFVPQVLLDERRLQYDLIWRDVSDAPEILIRIAARPHE